MYRKKNFLHIRLTRLNFRATMLLWGSLLKFGGQKICKFYEIGGFRKFCEFGDENFEDFKFCIIIGRKNFCSRV
jgi:hypothetical protein